MDFEEFSKKSRKFLSEKATGIVWKKLHKEILTREEKAYYWNYLSPKLKAINKLKEEIGEIENGK